MINRRIGALFVLSAVFFGGTFVAAKGGLEYFPPLLFVAIRFDIAAVVLLLVVLATHSWEELRPKTAGDIVGIVATGGLVIGLANALLFVGQQYATSAVGAIIFSLVPIFTPVFAAVLLSNERLSMRGIGGTLLGLLGVILVVSPNPTMLVDGDAIGRLILFGGAGSAALGAVLIRWAEPTISSTARITWGLPLAAGLSHGLAAAAGESYSSISWTPEALLALAYVSLVAGILAYLAYFALIDAAGAIKANFVFYAIPVVSTIGGIALLGETLSETALVGFMTIFIGFIIIGSESMDLRTQIRAMLTKEETTETPRRSRSD